MRFNWKPMARVARKSAFKIGLTASLLITSAIGPVSVASAAGEFSNSYIKLVFNCGMKSKNPSAYATGASLYRGTSFIANYGRYYGGEVKYVKVSPGLYTVKRVESILGSKTFKVSVARGDVKRVYVCS